MSALSKRSRVSAAPGQVSSTVDGEAVILNTTTGVYYGLDRVGAWVWETIQTPRTVSELHRELLDAFDVDAERADRDLRNLLEELAAARLITVSE
jgi:hypothetical protein